MASFVERVKERVEDVRRRRPLIDHLVRMQEHYGEVRAGQEAGAVTYFAFLSFFPILALAAFAVSLVAQIYPDADQALRDAVDSVLPGMVGDEEGQISMSDIRTFSGWVAVVGLAGVLYTGLGWVSALRVALVTVFEVPERERRGFVAGKLRDLVTLVTLGVVLLVAVAVTGFVSGFSDALLDWIGLGTELSWLVDLLTVVLGLAANTLLFLLMFRILAGPHVPMRSLWQGAFFGGLGFEVLKQLSQYLLGSTKDQPAFQAFGIALILIVWINYSTRVILYAAAFAYTTPEARALRQAEPTAPVQGPPSPPVDAEAVEGRGWAKPYAVGAVSTLGLMAVVRRLVDRR